MKRIFPVLILSLISVSSAAAEVAVVAPDVSVTKKSYPVPDNEQPFFGFVSKTPAQILADEKFTAQIVQVSGSRALALDEVLKRGWKALASGDMAMASRRFNQAYLIAPDQSRVYHAFAALVQARFNDTEYAEELFRVAFKQPNPSETLRADYGRLLLIAKRPADARRVLDQAVMDAPKFANAWSNLAFARLQTGDRKGACAAAAEAEKSFNLDDVKSDIALLKRDANC